MKLISFNIGIKIDNSKKVGEFIKSQKPDIVAFQEIMRHFDKSVLTMYKSKFYIEQIIGKRLPYSFFGPLWIAQTILRNGKIRRNFNGQVEQGNEIISRFPIVGATNEHYYKKYSYDSDRSNFLVEDHARALEIVEFKIKNKNLQILNLHGIYTEDKKDDQRKIDQSKYILEAARRKNIPTIIAGDFNLLPNTRSIQMLNKKFKNLIDEYQISSTRPDFCDNRNYGNNVVDYIFVSNKIKVNNFQVIKNNISDHYPLILDFGIK